MDFLYVMPGRRPNINILSLTLFEHSYPHEYGCAVSGSMTFICMLRHVRLAMPRAVTTRAWQYLVMYMSFALACLASLECSLACLPTCLLDSSINSFIDGCEEFKIFTYIVFQNWMFFCARADFLDHYRFPVSCYSVFDIYYFIACRVFTEKSPRGGVNRWQC